MVIELETLPTVPDILRALPGLTEEQCLAAITRLEKSNEAARAAKDVDSANIISNAIGSIRGRISELRGESHTEETPGLAAGTPGGIGEAPQEVPETPDAPEGDEDPDEAPETAAASPEPDEEVQAQPAGISRRKPPVASKNAIEMADKYDISLADIEGTGAAGKITVTDVREHIEANEEG